MSIHSEHRKRVKARFMAEGLDSFSSHQVLEMLLFYAIPRRDTNEIAHNLLNRFLSLENVLNAPVKELAKVEGMGENAALFIAFIRQFERYCQLHKNKELDIINSITDGGDFLVPYFEKKDNECIYLLCLDAKRKVLSCRLVEEGDVNSASISIRKVVDIALTEKATSVILAHNHPSGIAVPSEEDKAVTFRIAEALRYVDVTLLDHIVVADGDYTSMVHSRYYHPHFAVEELAESRYEADCLPG